LRSACRDGKKDFDRRKRLEKLGNNVGFFEKYAGRIVKLQSQGRKRPAAEITTSQPRSGLRLAARAVKSKVFSAVIFADDRGKIVAVIAHFPRGVGDTRLGDIFGEHGTGQSCGPFLFSTSLACHHAQFSKLQELFHNASVLYSDGFATA
jgi:hypothetical protein